MNMKMNFSMDEIRLKVEESLVSTKNFLVTSRLKIK